MIKRQQIEAPLSRSHDYLLSTFHCSLLQIHHDGVDGVHTKVNEPISIKEFERQHGTSLQGVSSTTGNHGGALERGAEKATGRDLNHDGQVGGHNNLGHSSTTTTGARGGGAEHAAEKATGRDINHDGQVGGHSGIGHSSTTTTGNHGGGLERGAEKATGRDINHDGQVGGNHSNVGQSSSTTGARGGALEHAAEKVLHKDLNHDGKVGKGQQQFAGGHALPNNQQRQL